MSYMERLKALSAAVKDGKTLTEEEIISLAPVSQKDRASWSKEKKELHDKLFQRYVGQIGMAPVPQIRKTSPEAIFRQKVTKEVGERYAAEHDLNKVTNMDVIQKILAGSEHKMGGYIEGDTGVGKTHTLIALMQTNTFFPMV